MNQVTKQKEDLRSALNAEVDSYLKNGGKIKILPSSDNGKNTATWGRLKGSPSMRGRYKRT